MPESARDFLLKLQEQAETEPPERESARDFLLKLQAEQPQSPKQETVLAEAEFPVRKYPWSKRLLSWALPSFIETPETDEFLPFKPDVIWPGKPTPSRFDPLSVQRRVEPERTTFSDTGELTTTEPEATASIPILEEPTGAALAGAFFPIAKGAATGLSWASRITRAAIEYTGWVTAGVTDVPRVAGAVAKGATKGAEKVARGAGAKRLETSLAPTQKTAAEGLIAPTIKAADVPTGAIGGAGKAVERETKQIREQFEERLKKLETGQAPEVVPEVQAPEVVLEGPVASLKTEVPEARGKVEPPAAPKGTEVALEGVAGVTDEAVGPIARGIEGRRGAAREVAPWEMTKAEYFKKSTGKRIGLAYTQGGVSNQKSSNTLKAHERLVESALSEGKPVAKSVLVDYPNLKAEVAKPTKPRKPGPGVRTMRGAIKQMGGINFLNFKGELKDMSTAVKFLSKKTGTPIDIVEQNLKAEGFMSEGESLLDILRGDPAVLRRGKVGDIGDLSAKPVSELTDAERQFKKELDFEPEVPLTEAELREGFNPEDVVQVGDLNKGDEFIIGGERFELKSFDNEGNALIEDGRIIKADVFETLDVDGIKRVVDEDVARARAPTQRTMLEPKPSIFDAPQKVETAVITEPEKFAAIDLVKDPHKSVPDQMSMFEPNQQDLFKKPRKLTTSQIDSTTKLYGGFPLDIESVKGLAKTWEKIGTAAWDTMVMDSLPKWVDDVPVLGKSTKKAFEFVKTSRPVREIKKALVYDYRGELKDTEKYMASLEDMRRGQSIGREYATDLGKRLQEFPEEAQLRMGQYITGEKVVLRGKEQSVADEARRSMLDLGKQAVEVGLLTEETFFKHAGRYMPRLYTSKEYTGLLGKFGIKKPLRLDLQRFKRRKDIPKEIREEMGEILTPGYPIAKGITQLTHDVEMARFFGGIAENPEWAIKRTKIQVLPADVDSKTWGMWDGDEILGTFGSKKEANAAKKDLLAEINEANPVPEGWGIIEGKRYGALDGAYVHPEIKGDLDMIAEMPSKTSKAWRKALGAWKFGKVILSPKTHMRNLFSNSILAHLGGMPMPVQPKFLARAAKVMRNKGDDWQKIRELGGLDHTFTAAELKGLFDDVSTQIHGTETMAEAVGKVGAMWEGAKRLGSKAADLYQAEEQIFKVAKYLHSKSKGATSEAAWKDAEKWLFNYSKITKFQEKYKNAFYGAPFATFTFKALPRVAEAWVKTPWRFALPGAAILGLEEAARRQIGDTREEAKAKRKLIPEWMKGSIFGLPNFVRVPFMRDADEREYYGNLTYVLPWGDIGEAGKFAGIPGGIRPFSQPFINEPVQQIMNYDKFYERQIVPDEDLAGKPMGGILDVAKGLIGRGMGTRVGTQTQRRAAHAVSAFAPTPVIDITKAVQALRGRPRRGKFKAPAAVALDIIAGIKLYPVDYEEQIAREMDEKNPDNPKGWMARKIMGAIRNLAINKEAVMEAGGNTDYYDDKIKERIEQLKGLGKELEELRKSSDIIRQGIVRRGTL